MTIHGPSSDNYDEAIQPTLMTDWQYQSAFDSWLQSLNNKTLGRNATFADNILVNGTGIPPSNPSTPPKYQLSFKKASDPGNQCIND